MVNYPTNLDTLTNPGTTDPLNSPSHAGQHSDANDILEALEAKVGINASAVTSSHDYKLSEVTSTDKSVGKTATQTLTNKTLTAPAIGTSILDTNGNELLLLTATASAVNELTYANAATGGAPTLAASGGDTDIDITLTPKGAGKTNLSAGDLNLPTNGNIQANDTDPWCTVSIFGGLAPTTTAGCAASATIEAGTNDIDYKVLAFDAATDENAFVNFTMPASWDGGAIQFQYQWTNAAGLTTETVTFELSARAYADSDAIDQAVGTAVEVADTWLAQGDVHTSAWSGDVTVAGSPAGGQWVHFEIMRDVSEDTMTGDARLIDVLIRYKKAKLSD